MWLRVDDRTHENPKIRAVRAAQRGAVEAVMFMWTYASLTGTNGWIPTWKVQELATPREIRALRTIRSIGRAPLLHDPDDECDCLTDKVWPVEGGYWVHDFLDRNPSKAENAVHRAKARELKDKELKLAVRQRDGDQCRYCGVTVKWADRKSGAGGVYDHVDPTIASGSDNLVVACRSCNGRKRDCTPAAAGMALLPPQTTNPFDPDPVDTDTVEPDPVQPALNQPANPRPINDGSSTGSTPDPRQITDPAQIRPESDPDPDPDPNLDPDPDPPPPPHRPPAPIAAAAAHPPTITVPITGPTSRAMTSGTGRGGDAAAPTSDRSLRDLVGDAGPAGHRRTIGPATTPRDALNPPPYRKSATANPPPRPPSLPPSPPPLSPSLPPPSREPP